MSYFDHRCHCGHMASGHSELSGLCDQCQCPGPRDLGPSEVRPLYPFAARVPLDQLQPLPVREPGQLVHFGGGPPITTCSCDQCRSAYRRITARAG